MQRFFENLFPQQQKGVEVTMICFIKIQSENMEMAWNIKLFISVQQLEEKGSKQDKVISQMWRLYGFVNNISII